MTEGMTLVVHMSGLPRQELGQRDPLVLEPCVQASAADDIADGVNPCEAGREPPIASDTTLFVSPHPGLVESKSFRIRNPSDRHQHRIRLESSSASRPAPARLRP